MPPPWWRRIGASVSDVGIGGVLLLVGLLLAVTVPDYGAQEWSLWVIYGLLALSLDPPVVVA